jgi:hypothetical protein
MGRWYPTRRARAAGDHDPDREQDDRRERGGEVRFGSEFDRHETSETEAKEFLGFLRHLIECARTLVSRVRDGGGVEAALVRYVEIAGRLGSGRYRLQSAGAVCRIAAATWNP